MVKRSGGLCLSDKPPGRPLVPCRFLAQEFHGNPPIELHIFCEIHLAHTSPAERAYDSVMADELAYSYPGLTLGNNRSRCFIGRRLDEAAGPVLAGEEQFDFATQFLVTPAGLVKESCTPAWLKLAGLLEQLLYSIPALRSHS